MKIIRLLAFFLFLFNYTNAGAQVFRDGATWYYSVSYGSYGGYEKISYIKDTLIDGKMVAVLQVDYHEVGLIDPDTYYHKDTTLANRYVYSDAVWMYQVIEGKPGYLYKLDPDSGQSWEVTSVDTCCQCTSNRVKVTATGSTTLADQTYRWFDIKSDSTSVIDVQSKVFVGIGPKNFPFRYSTKLCTGGVVDNATFELMCYQDDSTSVKFIPEDCDYIRYLSVNDMLYYNTRVFPNPADEVLNVQSDAALKKVSVYDHLGRLVAEEYANSRRDLQLPVKHLAKGLYLVKVESSRGMISKQVVIE